MEDLSSNPGELTEEQLKLLNREIGAKVLTRSGFHGSHQEIIDSSFEKARKHDEKLVGKNDERRNDAYLSRLEKLVDKYGNSIEKNAWAESIKDDLLIKYKDITKTYWKSEKQALRNEGYGSIELTEDRKKEIFEEKQKLQRESLEKWANYLGDEHSPYPLWFKVYAWDGITKMGAYNKTKGKYETRNETTVAPYPNPDAEVLGGVFEVVNRYYGNNEREFYTEEGERNIDLERIVQSGNFVKIFNAVQKDIAPIIEPPENPEDVKGDWVEYGIGEEDDIARAARGTGWCVASSSVGRYYLEYGTYGQSDDWDSEPASVKSKFILFHLQNPSNKKLSKNAVASIRLDPDGTVAEISGLKDGQALNDSLVSVVEKKVKTLPGGKEFLLKFADKQKLIELDRKMQNGEDLTKEELEFLYEINRPIETLDTYNDADPRIPELRKKYGIEYALDAGIDAGNLVSRLDSYGIAYNLDTLIQHDPNINVDELPDYSIIEHLDALVQYSTNFNINRFVSKLEPRQISSNFDTLIRHGADINIDWLVSKLQPDDIANHLDELIRHGADINIDWLVSKLRPYQIANNLDALIQYGADIDMSWLVSKLRADTTFENLDALTRHGADININRLVSDLGSTTILGNLKTLIQYGADIDQIVSSVDPYYYTSATDFREELMDLRNKLRN